MSQLWLALTCSFVLAALLAGGVAASGPPADPQEGPIPPRPPVPFYWVEPDGALPAGPQPQPNLPDLTVQWIERSPRYERYCLDYDRGIPKLCPGTQDVKHYPEPGEPVTLTAHIANQGTLSTTSTSALWTIAGPSQTLHQAMSLKPLHPGATTTLVLPWRWTVDPVTITLTLDPSTVLSETTRSNNRLSHYAQSLYLDIAVHPLVWEAFNNRPNLVGSWSFVDWIQAQFDAMNHVLAGSVYPDAPAGVMDRVRVDRVLVTEDVGGDTVTSTLEFDGRWTFRVEQDDPDTPEDEGAISAQGYAAAYASQIDWGLIHELAHQLGVIDLYQLNVAGSFQNDLSDADGRPLLLGFLWPNPGLMGGGDRGNLPWNRFSEHTALALNGNAGRRRGYFGEYLFDTPRQSSLKILDNQGRPLAGAHVALFQSTDNRVGSEPVFADTTDAEGRLALPNRDVPLDGLTTATGHTLAPNPFGAIDVVGRNGQLLIEVSDGKQRHYAWWPLTDFNLAAWHDVEVYERVISTQLAPTDAPPPPPRLEGRVDGVDVALWWAASPEADVVEYRVYRGEEPEFYPLTRVAATRDMAYQGRSLQTARYAVTAVDRQGRESGFSPVFRAQRSIDPVAIAVDPASGQRVILDRHDGALITQLPDDRWVGRQGSVHLGLSGSSALARDDQGHLLVAVTGEDQVKVVGPERELVNWFGRERFVTGTLAAPNGIARAGEPFTIGLKPMADGHTLGLATFDSDLGMSDAMPVAADQIERIPGRFGAAVRVSEGGQLLYDAHGYWDNIAGSVQLWVQPDWAWNDGGEHVFLEVGQAIPEDARGYRFRLAKAGWGGLYAWITDDVRQTVLYADVDQWRPAEWHHLAVAWQPAQPGTDYRRYTLWIDGVLQDSQVLRRPAQGSTALLSVGNSLDGIHASHAGIDEVLISRVGRVGNSQQAYMIVSQRNGHRVDVYDWMGTVVTSLGGRGEAPGQFDSPATVLAAGTRVIVADPGNSRVQVLNFDGDRLAPETTFDQNLVHPLGLALLEDDRLAVSDAGDHQVKLLAGDGRLLRRYQGPSDGHLGTFLRPAGLAALADGSLVVADAGNGRVVRIVGPLAPATLFLPAVNVAVVFRRQNLDIPAKCWYNSRTCLVGLAGQGLGSPAC